MRSSKAFEFLDPTVLGLCQPVIQGRILMLGQHRDECLGQRISEVEIIMSRADLCDLLALLLVQLDSLAHIQKGRLVLGTGGV